MKSLIDFLLLLSETAKWKREYFQSCQKFILAETLSPTFVGMNFDQVNSEYSYSNSSCGDHSNKERIIIKKTEKAFSQRPRA